jgi:hypothetical protein
MKSFIVFIFSFGCIVVHADHHEGVKGCHKEMKELCKDKKRGSEMFKCMKENKSKISPECLKKFEEKKEKWKNHEGPCKADREKFCNDVKHGEGRIIECMKGKMAELSPECKAHVEKEKVDRASGDTKAE